ncbi:hypothetical protein QQF64_034022 [Cirrhinus molitorella]|uniref:DDE Tnp4 domain-containing protein n=1 Tax=Cirrhinus molitorella TaxID=172907 RepID=A0ABR3MVJ6_9TELE
MPSSTVRRIVHRVAEELVAIRHKVIHLPNSPKDLEAFCRRFAGLARHIVFLKAAVAINGWHVCIKPPSDPDSQCYRNRKLFPSIILQAVCDHQDRFIDTYMGWPWSVHDARQPDSHRLCQPCKPVGTQHSGNMHSNTLETILDDVPPAERPYQGLYCGSPCRSSSSTRAFLLR